MTALVLGGMAVALPAEAQPEQATGTRPVAVSLDVAACTGADPGEVRRLFELELGTSIAPREGNAAGAAVSIDCDGDGIVLRVRDEVTDKQLERRIEIDPARRGRERLLALAATELLIASWVELETEGQRTREPTKPADRELRQQVRTITRPRVRREERWRATASLLGVVSREDHGVAPGAGARLTLDHASGFGGSIDLAGTTDTDTTSSLGDIDIDGVTASAAVHARWSWRQLVARAGVGMRGGAAVLTGQPASGTDARGGQVTGFVGGPFARLSLGAELASGLAFDVSVEPGYHVFPVRGLVDGDRAATLEGAWLRAQVAAGWSW